MMEENERNLLDLEDHIPISEEGLNWVVAASFRDDGDTHYGALANTDALALRTPLSILIESESGDSGIHQIRSETLRVYLMELTGNPSRQPDLVQIGMNVAVHCWDLGIEPFASMSQEEIGSLVARGRAEINRRHKRNVQKKLEKAGAKGTRNAKQKPLAMISKLSQAQAGNINRTKGEKLDKIAELFSPEQPNKP